MHEQAKWKEVSGRLLILYFVLTFVISWTFMIPVERELPDGLRMPFIIVAAFGPFISALIVIRAGRLGGVKLWLKEIFDPRGRVLVILAGAFLLPLILGAAHFGLYRALGGRPDFSEAYPWFSYPIALLLTALLTGGNEEPGWRGFALPALVEKVHPLAASLILGIIHSAWHLPMMDSYDTSVLMYFFNLTGLTFVFNWFYFRSKGCNIPLMLFHAATNVLGRYIPTPDDVLGGVGTFMMLRGIIYWAAAIVIIVATRGRIGCGERRQG